MKFRERPWRYWTLREWTCCGLTWQLLLSKQFPERQSFVPVCPTCGETMPRSKTAWKHAEKLTAKELKGRRILRGADFSKSDVDVIVDDFPFLRIDGLT